MKQDFIIRKFKKSDIEYLKKLSSDLIQTQTNINSLFYGLTITRMIEIEEEINNPLWCVFVAEYKKELIGFSEIKLDEKNAWFEIEKHALFVSIFINKSKYKNLDFYKIVFKLYKSCEDWAKKHNMKYLCADVYGENIRVRQLLKRQGFNEYKIKFVKKL